MPAKPDPLAGKSVGGYRLDSLLGRGAMAAVYAATSSDGQRVALKMLIGEAARDRELIKRFEREATIGKRVHHPSLCRIYGSGVDRGIRWLAMDLIHGSALDDRLDQHGPMPWREAMTMLRSAADAVAALHRQSIVHRDLKPGNILVAHNGTPTVIDLGFAKVPDEPSDKEHVGHGGEAAELTMAGMAMGSPAFMPPEQVSDAKSATSASDVYALAATLFNAITGQPPFHGGGAMQVMTKVIREPAPRLRSLNRDAPRGLDALLHRCLSKTPQQRPQDAQAFIAALDAVMARPHEDPSQSSGWWGWLRRLIGRS